MREIRQMPVTEPREYRICDFCGKEEGCRENGGRFWEVFRFEVGGERFDGCGACRKNLAGKLSAERDATQERLANSEE